MLEANWLPLGTNADPQKQTRQTWNIPSFDLSRSKPGRSNRNSQKAFLSKRHAEACKPENQVSGLRSNRGDLPITVLIDAVVAVAPLLLLDAASQSAKPIGGI